MFPTHHRAWLSLIVPLIVESHLWRESGSFPLSPLPLLNSISFYPPFIEKFNWQVRRSHCVRRFLTMQDLFGVPLTAFPIFFFFLPHPCEVSSFPPKLTVLNPPASCGREILRSFSTVFPLYFFDLCLIPPYHFHHRFHFSIPDGRLPTSGFFILFWLRLFAESYLLRDHICICVFAIFGPARSFLFSGTDIVVFAQRE